MKILLLAMSLTVLTVMLHSISTAVAIAQCRGREGVRLSRPWLHAVGTMAYLVILLLMAHLTAAALWAAALFWWVALPDFATAFYFSLTSYSTVGYGDVLLPDPVRILGPIESVLGVLMLGWSTAVIVAVVQRVFRESTSFGPSPGARSDSSRDATSNRTQEPAGPQGP